MKFYLGLGAAVALGNAPAFASDDTGAFYISPLGQYSMLTLRPMVCPVH